MTTEWKAEPMIEGHAPDCKCDKCGREWLRGNMEKTTMVEIDPNAKVFTLSTNGYGKSCLLTATTKGKMKKF